MSLVLSARQVRALRMSGQRLDPFENNLPTTPEGALQAMFGAQAQELPAALLSVRARSQGLTAAQLEGAQVADRSLIWTWLMRGTLHLVSAEDARWLIPLFAPGLIEAGERRMRQLGWDEERTRRGLRLLEQALMERGPLTRAEITALMAEQNLPHEGQAPVHLIYRAALEGILCGGPDAGKEHTYALLADWLGGLSPLPREEALARLALRYLEAFAPAAPRDLAAWSGLKISEARQGWDQIADQLEECQLSASLEGERGPLWLLKSQRSALDRLEARPAQPPQMRLLPRFDTLWMGYASRDLLIDPAFASRVNAGGGMVHPMLLVDGLVRGVWKMEQKKGVLEVRIAPFEGLDEALMPGLEEERADLARFLETEVHLVVP